MKKQKTKTPWIIVKAEPPRKGHERVFYFTGAQFAVSNIALKRIKIARFGDLNDPFELLSVDRSELKDRKAILTRTQEINRQTGLICFSKSWSNPVLWGHYAEKHSGVCLGFDVPEADLREVIYRESLDSIRKDAKTGTLELTDQSIRRLMCTKFKDWEYEHETRLFVDLENLKAESANYFLSFSNKLELREVVLGARCEMAIASIRRVVGPDVVVCKARLAVRSFKVVMNRRASRARDHAAKDGKP